MSDGLGDLVGDVEPGVGQFLASGYGYTFEEQANERAELFGGDLMPERQDEVFSCGYLRSELNQGVSLRCFGRLDDGRNKSCSVLEVVQQHPVAGPGRLGDVAQTPIGESVHSDFLSDALEERGSRVGHRIQSSHRRVPIGTLTAMQRTPNYSIPAHNRVLSDEEIAEFKADYRNYRHEQKISTFGVPIPPPKPSALAVSEEERLADYQEAWDDGLMPAIMGRYADLLVDKEANETAAQFIRDKIATVVKDPMVADTLTPKDYAFGTKRPCMDTGYFETFNRDNVDLVDLRETPIEAITASGIRTTGADFEFDVIVFATGFDGMVGPLNAIDIRGSGGVVLREEWKDGPRTYLGIGVAGFPNMFTITGPQSPSVLTNMVVSIEQHVDWIGDCITFIRDHDLKAIEATPEAQQGWVEHVEELVSGTLFPQTDSWWMGANVPGKPRGFHIYLGGLGAYRETCEQIAEKDYEGFELIS